MVVDGLTPDWSTDSPGEASSEPDPPEHHGQIIAESITSLYAVGLTLKLRADSPAAPLELRNLLSAIVQQIDERITELRALEDQLEAAEREE